MKKIFVAELSAACSLVSAIAEGLKAASEKVFVTVINRMPRHVSLPELGVFLTDVNASDDSNQAVASVSDKEMLLRAVSSIEAIIALNRYEDTCFLLMFEVDEALYQGDPDFLGTISDVVPEQVPADTQTPPAGTPDTEPPVEDSPTDAPQDPVEAAAGVPGEAAAVEAAAPAETAAETPATGRKNKK